MPLRKLFRPVVVLAAGWAFSTGAIPADWSPLSHDEAVENLKSPHLGERRKALARLAEIGTHDDVPLMLQRLWDEEDLVRGMAEQALWGLWMRANNSSADPLFQLGIALIVQGKIDEGIEQFNEVIHLAPDFAEAWNKRGDAYMHLGDYDKALADYLRALDLNPYHFGVLESCGEIWLERRNVRRAAEYFRRALDLNPNLFNSAVTLRELEQRLENDRI